MDLDQQTLADRIKNFLASHSQFRNPKFDPAPFLIQILKQKQSDHEAILQRRQDLIQLENQAFDIINQVCAEYSDQFFQLLDAPQQQGEQLQKLRSNMSLVKKKTKQTKSLLMNTQKDITQTYLNCLFCKIISKKLKQIQLKLHQYEAASLALKNNEFMNCSMNLPCFQGHSILQSALDTKAQNLRLQLLSRGIQQVSLFLYLTPKIVLPASQSLIERVSDEESIFGSLKKHQSFYKRYNLFKRAYCLEYLPTLWDFKDLESKKGKIHLMYDIIKGALNIGKIQEILQALEVDCKKSIKSIFLLLQYYFSVEIEQQNKKKKQKFKTYTVNTNTQQQDKWFLCSKGQDHVQFISVVMNVIGVMIRKLIILRTILKQYQLQGQQLSNLQCFTFFELIVKQLNEVVGNIYIKESTENLDFILQQIVKKIKVANNYIYWANIRNILTKSLIIIDQNLSTLNEEFPQKNLPKPKWDQILHLNKFDVEFYKNFHLNFNKTLQEIFCHSGKSFAFESLQEICTSKSINESEITFCRYFSSQEMKYSKQFIFSISFLQEIQRFFTLSNFDDSRKKKYQLFLLTILYLKLNYYLQKQFISSVTLEKAYQIRKTNSKVKTKQKDLKRQYDKICVQKKIQVRTKPWKKSATLQQGEKSKYRIVQNLKGIQKQIQMVLSYCMKNVKDLQKQIICQFDRYKDSDKIGAQIVVIDKLEPANYDQNFNSKLIRVWDQLPQLQISIMELTVGILQKMIQLLLTVIATVYLQSQTE